jgi:hypothetical protein
MPVSFIWTIHRTAGTTTWTYHRHRVQQHTQRRPRAWYLCATTYATRDADVNGPVSRRTSTGPCRPAVSSDKGIGKVRPFILVATEELTDLLTTPGV